MHATRGSLLLFSVLTTAPFCCHAFVAAPQHQRTSWTLRVSASAVTDRDNNYRMPVISRVRDKDSAQKVSVTQQQQQQQQVQKTSSSKNPYVNFAQHYPFLNNVLIATLKTGAADLLAQTVMASSPLRQLDMARSILFMTFGAIYSGGFQWMYQVRVFKKLFDVDAFTNKPWSKKLRDKAGLTSLGAQTALDLGILTVAYLPAFYIFKASVFSGSLDPAVWMQTGLSNYGANLSKDWFDLVRVWLPADLICFSVPLYLRLPVRHAVSFAWTAYLSFARGGH